MTAVLRLIACVMWLAGVVYATPAFAHAVLVETQPAGYESVGSKPGTVGGQTRGTVTNSDIISQVERYVVNPGQATAYMIGKLKIMELRQKARTELGDKFDIKAFHEVVLKSGPVPLDIMEENVNAWIASAKG